MFDQIQNIIGDLGLVALLVMLTSFFVGLALSFFYMYIKREEGYTSDFPWTLVMIPPVVAVLIIMIANNLAAGIAVGGLFALTRFRTNQRQTEDIAYILLTVVIGVIAGTGYLAFSVIFASFMMLALFVLFMIRFGKTTDHNIVLKISVPESLNYSNLFDDLLKNYCLSYNLNRVRTIDFGTMFEVTYYIVIKRSTVQKDFIDKIRVRNGNMTVTLTVQRFNVES
jgi:hypothetical protein